MGINKIFQFIQKKCPNAINSYTIDNYKKKTIAYDASMVLKYLLSRLFINSPHQPKL